MAGDEQQPEVSEDFLDQMRSESLKAFAEGRFLDALSSMQRGVMAASLRWFSDEGISFTRPDEEIPTTSLVLGLAVAASREVQERGEAASFRLQVAAQGLNAVAALRAVYDRPTSTTGTEYNERLAEMILTASDLGRIDGFMVQVRQGLLERLSAFEAERERRRFGAHKTLAAKATQKQQALGEAIRILGRNRNLSAEDVALKVREALHLPQAVKTITGWVRGWRRDGLLDDGELKC